MTLSPVETVTKVYQQELSLCKIIWHKNATCNGILPEDAKARLGKGRISEIQYSSDGAVSCCCDVVSVFGSMIQQHIKRFALLTAHTSAGQLPCLQSGWTHPLRVVARMAPFYYGIEAQVPKKCSPGVRNRSQT